jgi:glycosyltransferase involved in cell wall biosynthesis
MIRVGFIITANKTSWLGGMNYLRTLISAVSDFGSGELEPVLFLGHRFDPTARNVLPDVETNETSWLDPGRPEWLARGIGNYVLRNDYPLARLLRRHGVDVVSHSGPLGRHARLPAIAWIADFQHVRLPEFFDAGELRARDRQFRRWCRESARVIVSSESARADLVEFEPAAAAKSRVLHFVVDPPLPSAEPARQELLTRYGIREPFLHFPGQLWAHKNHAVVVEALGLLAEAEAEVTVAATGDADDYRHPGHSRQLAKRIQAAGVADRFRLLGRVPYADVVGLMRASAAVLNPSLFEGWSTTVEEAKSLGKRVVLSDIPVHREQAPPEALYFDPRSPEALAGAITQALAEWDRAADQRREGEARAALPARRRDFALSYEEIVREALAA